MPDTYTECDYYRSGVASAAFGMVPHEAIMSAFYLSENGFEFDVAIEVILHLKDAVNKFYCKG